MKSLLTRWPRCAKCNKGVDEMRSIEDPFERVLIVTVKCHGETETTEMKESLLVWATSVSPEDVFIETGRLAT